MIESQRHGVSPKYLHQYANHDAWLEDSSVLMTRHESLHSAEPETAAFKGSLEPPERGSRLRHRRREFRQFLGMPLTPKLRHALKVLDD
jgi:hypothetical protein